MGRVYHFLQTVPSWTEQLTIHQLLVGAGIITVATWFVLVTSGRRFS